MSKPEHFFEPILPVHTTVHVICKGRDGYIGRKNFTVKLSDGATEDIIHLALCEAFEAYGINPQNIEDIVLEDIDISFSFGEVPAQ